MTRGTRTSSRLPATHPRAGRQGHSSAFGRILDQNGMQLESRGDHGRRSQRVSAESIPYFSGPPAMNLEMGALARSGVALGAAVLLLGAASSNGAQPLTSQMPTDAEIMEMMNRATGNWPARRPGTAPRSRLPWLRQLLGHIPRAGERRRVAADQSRACTRTSPRIRAAMRTSPTRLRGRTHSLLVCTGG